MQELCKIDGLRKRFIPRRAYSSPASRLDTFRIMSYSWLIFGIGFLGCSDYAVKQLNDPSSQGAEDTHMQTLDPGNWTAADDLIRCAGELELADMVSYDETCSLEAETGSIASIVEWEIDGFMEYWEYGEVLMAPVVGQLSDDDGDGDIDADDIPDIVVVTDDGGHQGSTHGVIRRIPGDGSGDVLTLQQTFYQEDIQVHPYRYSNVALGDVDGDGIAEIILMASVIEGSLGDPSDPSDDPDTPVWPATPPPEGGGESGQGDEVCVLVAFTADLELFWLSEDVQVDCGGHAPALVDLEGDGEVEVLLGPYIVHGETGELRGRNDDAEGRFFAYEEIGMHVAAADLNMDGVSEILLGNTLVDPSGATICQAIDLEDGYTAAADFDADGAGEVVVVGNGLVGIYDQNCQVWSSWTLVGGGTGGPPTVSDFDTDGHVEIGIAEAETYTVYESDGSVLWSHPVSDESSHATGSVVFDFEADGRPEVVYADETRLWILAGEDGTVRLEDARHASRTLHEYPTIADVDGDGSSEIIVPNGGGHLGEERSGLYVLGPAEGTWLMSRQLWNQHAYAIVNVDDGLGIPSPAASNWPTHNNFRSGDLQPQPSWMASDPVPMAELCLTECPQDRIIVIVRGGNSGAVDFRDGIPISLYTNPTDPVHLETLWTGESVSPGGTSDLLFFEVPVTDVLGEELWVVVDDDNGTEYVPQECDEDNNIQRFEDVRCP